MTCSISAELEQQLTAEAAERQTTVEEIVEQAIRQFLTKPSGGNSHLNQDEWLSTFRALQQSLALTEESAAEWKQDIYAGRR